MMWKSGSTVIQFLTCEETRRNYFYGKQRLSPVSSMKLAYHYFFGVFYIVTFVQGISWSTWESCSKTCGDGIQRRTLNCTSIKQASKEWQNCNKETQTKNCGNRPCSDFALKCYQCQGSEANCHENKLKRNQTYDACNRYHNKCITKRFELEADVKEVTRGCGNEAQCRISAERCKGKGYPRYRCHVSCCEEDYCNKGNVLGGPLCDSVVLLGTVFLSLTVHFHWC